MNDVIYDSYNTKLIQLTNQLEQLIKKDPDLVFQDDLLKAIHYTVHNRKWVNKRQYDEAMLSIKKKLSLHGKVQEAAVRPE